MENRKERRFEEKNPVFIKDKAGALRSLTDGGINAHTHDISVSGAWICCPQDFPLGYVVRMVIDLEGTGQFLEVDGDVVWSRKSDDGGSFDIGVEFRHDLPDTVLMLIKHFYAKKPAVPTHIS